NYPFECNLKEIGSDWIKQEVQEMKKAALAGFVMNASQSIDSKSFSYGVSHKKLAKVIKKMASKGSIDEQYKYFRQFMRKSTGYEPSNTDRFFSNINSQLERVGIFSLAESSSNQLMWSHYGGEHYGICIGFDEKVPNVKLNDPNSCLKVRYSNELPKMSENGFKTELGMSMSKDGQLQNSHFQLSFTD
ncbi:DUF2971 domain-containing protein, partial [Vibrio anguillarum]|uniref:DUF2971 domain-containing protein n=1 Tax=Vibrio anguillarum TaxID=55601 RepID=UPI001BE4B6E0